MVAIWKWIPEISQRFFDDRKKVVISVGSFPVRIWRVTSAQLVLNFQFVGSINFQNCSFGDGWSGEIGAVNTVGKIRRNATKTAFK